MRGFMLPVGSIVTAFATRGRTARYSTTHGLQQRMRDETGLFELAIFEDLVRDRLERGLVHGASAAIAVLELEIAESSVVDRASAGVARAIRASIRPSDLAARLSPMSFVTLLDRCDREEAKHVCSRIMRGVLRLGTIGRLSCGIAVAPTDGGTLDQLIVAASRAPAPARASERILVAS